MTRCQGKKNNRGKRQTEERGRETETETERDRQTTRHTDRRTDRHGERSHNTSKMCSCVGDFKGWIRKRAGRRIESSEHADAAYVKPIQVRKHSTKLRVHLVISRALFVLLFVLLFGWGLGGKGRRKGNESNQRQNGKEEQTPPHTPIQQTTQSIVHHSLNHVQSLVDLLQVMSLGHPLV